MKTETFFWIIIGLFALIALLGFIFILKDKEKIGKRLLKSSGYAILFIYIFIISAPRTQNYVLYKDQELWEKYGLPQIDSCMFVEFNTNKFLIYSSWCNDSITHLRKWVEYDIFDIYSIKDVFINKRDSQTLTFNFIKPNILRDSSLIVTINNDTISKTQGDLILKDWGIYKRAYRIYFDR